MQLADAFLSLKLLAPCLGVATLDSVVVARVVAVDLVLSLPPLAI